MTKKYISQWLLKTAVLEKMHDYVNMELQLIAKSKKCLWGTRVTRGK